MTCNSCGEPVKVLLNQEMICFDCYNKRKLATPQRHNHKIQPPKPVH